MRPPGEVKQPPIIERVIKSHPRYQTHLFAPFAKVASTYADGIKIQIYFHINSYKMILKISPEIHQASYFQSIKRS